MGGFYALINAAGWSIGMVFAQRAQRRAKIGILGGLYCSLLVNLAVNLVLFPITLLFSPLPVFTGRGVMYFILAGLFNSLIGRGLLFYTILYLGVARAGVLKAATPVFALLYGVFLLHEVLTPLDWLGIVVVIGGVLLVAVDGARRAAADWDMRGIPLGILASLFLALGNLFRKMGVQEIPSPSAGVLIGAVSGVVALSAFLLVTEPKTVTDAIGHIDRDYALSGLSTSVALFFLFTSLQMIPLSIANSLTAVEPLITIVMGRLLLGKQEPLTPAVGIGAASTVIGAVLLACF